MTRLLGMHGLSMLALLAAPETTSGASAPATQRPTSATAPKPSAGTAPTSSTSSAPQAKAAIGGTDTKAGTPETDPAKDASAASAATPASPVAPEAPRRGRPPKDGATATASAPKVAVPPSEMGMGALLKEAVKAAERVKARTGELVQASDALAELTTEMQKRLQ